MRWLIVGIVALAGLSLVIVGIGWMLPVQHTARRQQRLPASPDAVWRAITDIDAFPSWRPDLTRVERLPDRDGRAAWIEEGANGRMTLAIERSEAPRLMVTRIQPGLPFGGTWTYAIAPDGDGSLLTITEDGEVYNPVFRFMSRYVFGHEATLAAYMTALEQRLSGAAAR